MSVRKITARYAGKCGDPECGGDVAVGDLILYGGRGKVAHATCSLENVPAGPTTRERKLAKAERLRDWSAGRAAKAEAGHARAQQMASIIPLGQPILIGHHSERRDRNYRAKFNRMYERSFEDANKAQSMASRADNIEHAAEHAIYSDDPDAIERLTERIVELEAKRDRYKAENAAYRKAHRAELKELSAYDRHERMPHASYEITNLTGLIGSKRKRLEYLKREAVSA